MQPFSNIVRAVLALNGEKDLQVPPKENLAEIEKSVSAGKIDSSNKKWMLEYLEKLHQKISETRIMVNLLPHNHRFPHILDRIPMT